MLKYIFLFTNPITGEFRNESFVSVTAKPRTPEQLIKDTAWFALMVGVCPLVFYVNSTIKISTPTGDTIIKN